MALSDTAQIRICQMFSVQPYELILQLSWVGTRLTAAMEADIVAQIALWDAGAGTKTTYLRPTESNKGVRTDPDAQRSTIRNNIAVLLERPDWGTSSSQYLPRG